jgi:hypothetical protein
VNKVQDKLLISLGTRVQVIVSSKASANLEMSHRC